MEDPGSGRFVGGYRLERLLGRGGMGAVWLAADPRLDRMVALKLLSESLSGDPHFRQRFIAESQRAASLDHPHIVPIFDADEADGELFIAMRYVAGTTLEGLIAEGPLDSARALGLLRGIADALDAAHAAGLVHRDVKPGNILVARTPTGEHAYLADFGLVKRVGDASLTGTGQVVGSVGYVAPEQIDGKPVDGRADVYSLGCVLYTAVTGAGPFVRDTDMATLYAHMSAPIPHPSAVRPELAPLDPVIEQAMAKDPDARFRSAGAVIAAATDALRTGTTRGFLFADLRGYTAFVDQNGDQAGAGLLARYRDLTRTVMRSHQGAEIRTEGDSFYIVFPSASSAVSAALALVEEAARQTTSGTSVPIFVGVGVHAGETAETAEGPVGSAVNTAARLCAAAGPGEVLVSDTVRGLVRTSLAVAFDDRGKRTLKGLAEPVRIWKVRRDAAGTGPAGVKARLRLGPTLRRRLWSPVTLGAGAVLVVVVLVASALGFGRGGGSAVVSPVASTSTAAGSVAPASATAGTGAADGSSEWIAYARRAPYVDGDLSCAAPSYAADAIASELHLVRPDGSDDHRLAQRSDIFEHRAAWAADGSTVFLVGSSGRQRAIWSVGPDGSPPRAVLVDTDSQREGPAVAHDGRLAWLNPGPNTIGVSNADGTDPKEIATRLVDPNSKPDSPSAAPISDLTWLPDGRLGFVAHTVAPVLPEEETPAGVLYTISADGTGLVNVGGVDGLAISQARWAPDGKRVALTIRDGTRTTIDIASSTMGDPVVIDRATTHRIDDGTGQADTTARDPAWSPDGSRLAFASARTGTYEIHTVDRAGASTSQVTHTEAARASCGPSWGSTKVAMPGPEPAPSPGIPVTLQRGWLSGGTYAAATFDPTFRVALPEGWQAWMTDVDDVWLRRFTKETNVDVDIGRITVVYPKGCYGSSTELAPTTAHDLIAWLQKRPKLKVGPPKTTQVGGSPAIQVDVTGASPGKCDPLPNRILMFDVANGSLFVRPGETIRLIAVDVKGTLVVIVPRAFSQSDQVGTFNASLLDQLARPVLDAIEFGPGT